MRRALALLLGAIIGWLGLVGPSPAVATPTPAAAHAHTYDGHAQPAQLTGTTLERGPPELALAETTYDTAGGLPRGAWARPDGPTPATVIDYDHPGGLAQEARATGTTPGDAQGTHASSCAFGPSRVAANAGDDAGELVYRVHGGDARQWGHSWTTENPLKMANPRADLGLPKVNSGEYVTCARVCNADGVIKRNALPLDGNPGGGPELLVPNPQQQLQHLWTIRAEPPL